VASEHSPAHTTRLSNLLPDSRHPCAPMTAADRGFLFMAFSVLVVPHVTQHAIPSRLESESINRQRHLHHSNEVPQWPHLVTK
jgi:hypothetical protein